MSSMANPLLPDPARESAREQANAMAQQAAVAAVEARNRPIQFATKAQTQSERVWQTVERLGTQRAAAKALNMRQSAIQRGLDRYMADHGIEGPRPGLIAKRAMTAAENEALIERVRPFQERRAAGLEAPTAARRLTTEQADLVLSAGLSPLVTHDPLHVARRMRERLTEAGFELVVTA